MSSTKPEPQQAGNDAPLGGRRWFFALTHLVASAAVLAVLAAGVFVVWYPPPYASLSGGLKLFGLLAVVDIFLGPLGTLVVSNPRKLRTEWRRDVAMIIVLQLGALSYGLWTVYEARPVHLVFEIDRFRVVPATDVPMSQLSQAPLGLRALPKTGPVLIATRPFRNRGEQDSATIAALQGLDIGARPEFWMPYQDAVPAVLSVAKPMADLVRTASPASRSLIMGELARLGRPSETLVYLPLVSRNQFWTVLLDAKSAQPLGFIELDGFGTDQ